MFMPFAYIPGETGLEVKQLDLTQFIEVEPLYLLYYARPLLLLNMIHSCGVFPCVIVEGEEY